MLNVDAIPGSNVPFNLNNCTVGAQSPSTTQANTFGGGYGGDGTTISATQISPVLTSGFRTESRPNHHGIDIGFKGDLGGQPMYLPDKAKITSNGFDSGYGNYVTFTTQDDNLTHLYGHMQQKTPLGVGKMLPSGEFVGNLGNNYKYQANEDETFDIFYNDFDGNNSGDIVLSYYNDGEQYPLRGRQCSSEQIPAIKLKFDDYDAFSIASKTCSFLT